MLSKYRNFTIKTLSEHCGLVKPDYKPEGLTLDSPALLLMVDFTKRPATTVNESITVNDALEIMKINHVRALMVVDHNGEFRGVITAMDLMGGKPMLYANEAGIAPVDVLVKNIMLNKSKLNAIDKAEVEKSSIGDVVNTLMQINEQHIMVVEGEAEEMQICGLFSASDFKRALSVSFDMPVVAHTFSDLERVINEHKDVM